MPRKKRTAQEILADTKAKWETIVYKARINKHRNPVNKYDAVDVNNSEKRRAAKIEMCDEEGMLRPYDRLKMINLCRDLERNSSSAKGILKQFKSNVIGQLGKLQLNTEDEATNEIVNHWFNKVWAVNSNYRDDLHFADQLKLDVATVLREGDFVLTFDDYNNDNGKLVRWEADQLVEINEIDWKAQTDWTEEIKVDGKTKTVPLKQSAGVIFDSEGVVRAYAVSSKRGLTKVKLKEATILPRGVAKLIKNPFRHNQLRGTGDFFATIADMEDVYEMRAKELQSAKANASRAGVVIKEDADSEAVFRGGVGPESLLETADGATEVTEPVTNYESLETLTGGLFEYLLPGEDVKMLDPANRPNIHVQEFFDFVIESSGAGFGMAKAYSRMRADTSYTAFRGEMLMTWWGCFYEMQKFIERYICDWVAIKAIEWGVRKNQLNISLPDNWQTMISWVFPTMPQIDPDKEGKAIDAAIKNGRMSFEDLLGPDWKKKLNKVSEGLIYAKALGLPLGAFETVAGATVEDNNDSES